MGPWLVKNPKLADLWSNVKFSELALNRLVSNTLFIFLGRYNLQLTMALKQLIFFMVCLIAVTGYAQKPQAVLRIYKRLGFLDNNDERHRR